MNGNRLAVAALVLLAAAAPGCGSGARGLGAGGTGAPGSSGAAGRGGTGGGAGLAGGAGDAASPDDSGAPSDAPDASGGGPDGSESDGALDVTDAYAGVCPPPTPPPPPLVQINLCRTCPGVSCAAGDRCESTYHQTGWFTTVCTCLDGQMGCCEGSDLYGLVSCNYGGSPPPGCPAARPTSGEPCGPPATGCRFSDPCCAGDITTRGGSAWCASGSWNVRCPQPLPGTDCSTVPSGTRCDVPSTGDGASAACRCDDLDAGGKMWTCGPEI